MQRVSIREIKEWVDVLPQNLNAGPSFEQTVIYINDLPVDVGISMRNGMKTRIRRNVRGYGVAHQTRTFKIATRIKVDKKVRESLLECVSSRSAENFRELQLADEQLLKQETKSPNNFFFTISYVREITEEMIREGGGSVYVEEADIVVSFWSNNIAPPDHPESFEGKLRNLGRAVRDMNQPTGDGTNFILNIKICDRSNKIGRRWTRLFGEIIAIDPVVDSKLADGIYITAPQAVNSAMEESPMKLEYFIREEEYERYGLFKTFQEAARFDIDREIKFAELETRALNAESALTRAELERDRLVDELRLQEAKSAEAKLEHQRKMEQIRAEAESQRDKYHYEKKSSFRKNLVDFFKTIPALLTAGMAAFVAIKKIFGVPV